MVLTCRVRFLTIVRLKLPDFLWGEEMKTFALALALSAAASASLAGGIEPVMDPVVVATAASSANDNWAGITLTLLLLAAALD